MHSHKRVVALVGLATLAASAAILVATSASAQAGRTLTFKELEKGSTFTHIRNTKSTSERANTQGDVLAFAYPLAAASGRVVGRLHVECVTTMGARNFLKSIMTCSGVVVLEDGILTVQTTVSPGVPTTSGAVTGGTGAYANARGVFVSKPGPRGSVDTFTLED